MIITLKKEASKEEIAKLRSYIEGYGLKIHAITGESFTVFGLIGDTTRIYERDIQAYECVEDVQRVQAAYKLANRMFHPEDTVVEVGDIKIGGNNPIVIMGGPCAVESADCIERLAGECKEAGAQILRGGAYKPRTSPYSFQGMQTEGIHCMADAGRKHGMPIITEIISAENLAEFVENVDILQIGARNMQNFALLKAVGKTRKPVMLKRGMSATVDEWIMAAEYIMSEGNPNVIMCERGIRTFEKSTRNTMDLAVIPIIKEKTHLPVVIDPSHATGDWKLVEPVSLAAIAAGADGLIIEVHDKPEEAMSDGKQSLKPAKFAALIEKAKKVAAAVDREIL